MAVKIRLSRVGRHKRPLYRIVVADSNAPRNGKLIEILGSYDPLCKKIAMDEDSAVKWLKEGAIATQTVRTILNKSQLYKKASGSEAS